MGFRKFCGITTCAALLALTGCQTIDTAAPRPTAQAPAPSAPQTAAGAPAARPNVPFTTFLQEPGTTGRLGPVTSRSTAVTAPGLTLIVRPPVPGSGWQTTAIALPGLTPPARSSIPPQTLDRARAIGSGLADTYRALNEARANENETAAVVLALAMVHTGRYAEPLRWMLDAALQDGSAVNALLLSEIVRQGAQAALNSPNLPADPARRAPFEGTIDLAAGLMLNGFVLTVVDGFKCADRSAGETRVVQQMSQRQEFINAIRAFAPDRRARIKRFAFALEESTASARAPDPTICRAGGEETMRATSESWAANLPNGSPELERRGRRGPDGVLYVTVPATPERPDMYRPASEFPALMARGREVATRLVDQLIP